MDFWICQKPPEKFSLNESHHLGAIIHIIYIYNDNSSMHIQISLEICRQNYIIYISTVYIYMYLYTYTLYCSW